MDTKRQRNTFPPHVEIGVESAGAISARSGGAGHPCTCRHLPDAACRHTASTPPTAGTTIELCERCHRETITMLMQLSSGHIGRVCAECRCCRRFRPYASKREFYQAKTATGGRGLKHGRT